MSAINPPLPFRVVAASQSEASGCLCFLLKRIVFIFRTTHLFYLTKTKPFDCGINSLLSINSFFTPNSLNKLFVSEQTVCSQPVISFLSPQIICLLNAALPLRYPFPYSSISRSIISIHLFLSVPTHVFNSLERLTFMTVSSRI